MWYTDRKVNWEKIQLFSNEMDKKEKFGNGIIPCRVLLNKAIDRMPTEKEGKRMFSFTGARGEEFEEELMEFLHPLLRHAKSQRKVSGLGNVTPHVSELPEEKRVQVGPHTIYIPYHGKFVNSEALPYEKRDVYPLPKDAPWTLRLYINDSRNALIVVDFLSEQFELALEEIRTNPEFAHLYCFLNGPVSVGPHCDTCCPCFKEDKTPCSSCRDRMRG